MFIFSILKMTLLISEIKRKVLLKFIIFHNPASPKVFLHPCLRASPTPGSVALSPRALTIFKTTPEEDLEWKSRLEWTLQEWTADLKFLKKLEGQLECSPCAVL